MNDPFDMVQDYIAKCLALIAEGGEADLKKLDQMAGQAGAKIMQMPDAEKRANAPRISLIAESLAALEQVMAARKGELAQEMQGLFALKRAGMAYRAADARAANGE